ncbi:hypothetical protein EZ428_11860 [Pedobacter frigiditerrae]|uniref:Uncharacterized protein n=1 Tax=Pedobacter frigiditerrae TaxID=2530452 RepID=A0A4R0MYJ5_9SPHI|nr:hypothetical protein [Pedobacter frigiditerrae]TCC92408.1 hypothetical protein EZ428_11860 [Pedobacter frigiditerrae]
MEKTVFLLEGAQKDINSKFTKAGWIDIFRDGDKYSGGVFCYLITDAYLNEHLKNRDIGIWKGSEGRPSVSTFYLPDGEVTRYSSFDKEGLEPFLYSKYFPEERYIDVSEEFVNYFKLYENGTSKQERKYYFHDDLGDKEEVIVITSDNVRIKQKFLMEYIAVRRMHLAICFDFMAIGDVPLKEFGVELQDVDKISDWHNYNHLIRVSFGSTEIQSWIRGKLIIKYDPTKSEKTWYDLDYQYEQFVIGYDEDTGQEALVSCDSEEHQFFVQVFFKKDVLSKYYNNPEKYSVDGFGISCGAFSLKMDNNNDGYVMVFLNDLRMLPQKEQLHWKHHNIAPQPGMGMSGSYYDTMIQGNWARKSDAIDVRFKQEYKSFNKKWFDRFGWHFYKEPSGADVHLFNGLHLPADNSIIAFCDQMLIVVKFTIDSLNEEMLIKNLPKIENEKGIAKFERFIKERVEDIPDMFIFIRHLQNLRSGMIAHKFSESNKNCKKAMEYFGLTTENYRDVAANILVKSLWTLNVLNKLFLNDATNKEESK